MNPAPRASLDWLISPVATNDFFESYWEKQPLIVERNQPGYFGSLLSFDDIDRIIATMDRRYPDICLKNAKDAALSSSDYTLSDGALDVAKVYQLFEQGSTLTLAFLDTVIPALNVFCRNLEAEFSCPLQANAYMTPPRAQGAEAHYDTHDVFVLQIAGSKRWTIFETPVESPLPGQQFDARVHNLGAPTLEFELRAGDLAYIPRGVGHAAHSTDVVSVHITTGILRYTWIDLLLEHLAITALNHPAFRKTLPPGFAQSDFNRTQARETVQNLLREAATAPSFDPALDGFIERFLAKCPPVLDGQMEQLARLGSLTIDSVVGIRQGVVFRLKSNHASESIETYGRTITYPQHASEAVRFALKHPKFTIRNLPGTLDDAGKLTLIRRLIREGLIVAL